MPRSKEQFEQMRRVTKEKIQEAAMRLFAKKGLAATNVQDIADEAEISIGLLYRHYKTKEALFYELVEMAIEGLKEVSAFLQADLSPKVIMEQLWQEIYEDLQHNEDYGNLMVLLTQAILLGQEASKMDHLLQQDFVFIQEMANLIERGQQAGEFAPGDPYGMSMMFISTVQGIAISKMAFGDKFRFPARDMVTAYLYTNRSEGNDGHGDLDS